LTIAVTSLAAGAARGANYGPIWVGGKPELTPFSMSGEARLAPRGRADRIRKKIDPAREIRDLAQIRRKFV
jgi:hypothetical protein